MKTDIDRLHNVVLEKKDKEWSGETFAKCHEIAGIIEIGEFKKIVCVISCYRDIQHILPMLMDVFSEHSLPKLGKGTVSDRVFFFGEVEITFIPYSILEEKARGLDNFYLCEFEERFSPFSSMRIQEKLNKKEKERPYCYERKEFFLNGCN